MATSNHDYEGTISLAAIAGGVTAGTLIALATSSAVVNPLTTATSLQTWTAKEAGLVKGVFKSTALAWTHGAQLAFASSVFAIASAGALCVATAYGIAATADTTGDVVLNTPRSASA